MSIETKMRDVEFKKCEEYNPMHPKANSMGMRKFWRADYNGQTIATLCDTKTECVAEVRRYLKGE